MSKIKIFSITFWKAIFGLGGPSKSPSETAPESLPESKPMSEYLPTSQNPSEVILEVPQTISEENRVQGEKVQEDQVEEKQKEEQVETVQEKVVEESEQKEPTEQKPIEEAKKEKPIKTQIERKGESLIVRSELNLEKNAVFTVSTCREKSREVITKEIGPKGEIAERKILVGKTAEGFETGVLTTNHFKVYLTLIELWERAGKPINDPVHFTIYKINKRLGLEDDGRTYTRVKRSLYGLRQIPIEFINSFFIPKQGDFTTLEPFTVLNHLSIYERKKVGKQGKTRGYGEFQFDRHVLENLVNNHTHPLRLDVINSFEKHKDMAILLYAYLDRCLAFKDKYEINLGKLFEHLDLSQQHIPYPAKRKQRITPVIQELQGKELSTGILSYIRILKTEDGKDYKLVCHKKPFSALPARETSSQLALEGFQPEQEQPDQPELSLLVQKGLTQKQAEKLLSEQGIEVIRTQLDFFPFRIEEYLSQGKEVNESALLYDSIQDNWQPPQTFFEAEKKKESEAKLQALKEEYQKRVKEAKEEAGEWAARSPEERISERLQFWVVGQTTLGHRQPSEEEIQAKREELISDLPTQEEYENQLIAEIKKDIQAQKQKVQAL